MRSGEPSIECGVELRHAEEQIFALVNELLET